ncbi:hypothetical protein KLP28_12390 [Nocardioidaceae bacterium]|nr:hypothetical protein KLP28_12390 [Nocardioidaceae bacterium]
MVPPAELRVRPLSPEEYALWHAGRGDALDLPARPGTTEVGVLVYARTGPVANALVRAEPGVRLTAEIRALDVTDDALATTVVEAVVQNFTRGGYTHFRAWAGESALATFTTAGFDVVGRDLTLDLSGDAVGPRTPKGRSRFSRKPSGDALEVAEAGEKDAASFLAWLTSARTLAAMPRTPNRAALRAMRSSSGQHFLTLREGDGVVADVWVSEVEAAGESGVTVRGGVLHALRLRGGFDTSALDGVDAALRSWARDRGFVRLDAHVPGTADQTLVEHALARGFRDAGTQLERTVEDPDS